MPYSSNYELPDNVTNVLPQHAQDIYREAFNNALHQYSDPDDRKSDASQEETAARVAWSAVKEEYEKGEDGNWHRRDD